MKRGRRLFTAAAACVPLAALVRFALVGYRTTAFCLLALAACLAFYGLMRRWGTKTAKALELLVGVCLLLGFGLFLTAEVPIVRDARSDEDTAAPYCIVMGAAVHGSTPSLSMAERTDAALQWLREHPEGIAVLSGGQGPGEDMTEARAMADYLTARGIPRNRLLLEEAAATSYENLLFSLRVIRENGGDPAGRIALCSSEYHLHRLNLIAAALGAKPVDVAAKTGHVTLRINYFVREAFAVWKCRLFGFD